MNAFLVSVTIVSLALAIGMGLLAAYVFREERRRSDARVAALEQMAVEPAGYDARLEFLPEPDALPAAPPGAPYEPEAERAPAIEGMFAPRDQASPWTLRLGIAGGLAFAGLIVMGATWLRTPAGTATGPAPAGETRAAASAPLELVSLRHSLANGELTITGLVQKLPGDTALSGLTATAFLFGSDGSYITSGRAPLNMATIGPGDAATFVITIPVSTPIARYRVSFRDESGRIVSHVDHRTARAVARNE